MSRPARLDAEAIAAKLTDFPDWQSDGTSLTRTFEFADFRAAMDWMNQVAEHAETLDHHPDWTNSYREVRVSVTTHDVGGLTFLDFALASQMDHLFCDFHGDHD